MEAAGHGTCDSGGSGGAAGQSFGGGLGTADDGGVAADEAEGVLVQDGGHGFVEFGQLMAELDGAFEEYFHRYGPEFVIVGCGIVAEQIFGAALLHGGKDGPGYFGEVGKFFFKVFVFLGLGDEVDIGQGMGHFVEAHITIGRLAGNALDKIVPGEVDTRLIYVAHERPGVESIVVVIAQDEDIVEIVEFEFIQAEGQLHGNGADEDGHFGGLFHLYIPEVLGMLEEPGAEQKFALLLQTQPIIIAQMVGYNRVIEGLSHNKTLKLMPVVKALNKQRNGAVQQENTQYQ